jgi:hypothetical protein
MARPTSELWYCSRGFESISQIYFSFQQNQLEDWNGLISLLKELQADIDAARTDRKKQDGLEAAQWC